MIYRLYDNEGNLMDTDDCVENALEAFGKVYDQTVDDFGKGLADGMTVKVFVDKGKGNKMKFAEYPIKEFLNKDPRAIQPIKGLKVEPKYFGVAAAEDLKEFSNRARNFDEAEQKEALKYIPTGFILGELARRFEEYNNAKAGIASIIENMKIYNKE